MNKPSAKPRNCNFCCPTPHKMWCRKCLFLRLQTSYDVRISGISLLFAKLFWQKKIASHNGCPPADARLLFKIFSGITVLLHSAARLLKTLRSQWALRNAQRGWTGKGARFWNLLRKKLGASRKPFLSFSSLLVKEETLLRKRRIVHPYPASPPPTFCDTTINFKILRNEFQLYLMQPCWNLSSIWPPHTIM